MRYSAERSTSDLTAYDLFLRARSIASTYERSHLAEALELLEQAIRREPRYGPALALAATYRVDLENFDGVMIAKNRRTARWPSIWPGGLFAPPQTTRGVLGRAAMVLGRFGEDIDAALALVDRALALNPSFAYGWYWSGWPRLFAGQADVAIQHFDTSMRLNPRSQRGFHLAGIGTAYFVSRRFDVALAAVRVSLEEVPAFAPAYRTLAACYGHLGRLAEAQSVIKRLVSLPPWLCRLLIRSGTLSLEPCMQKGFGKAGMPEE